MNFTCDFFWLPLVFCLLSYSLPEVGCGRTVWSSPASTIELMRSSLLLCLWGSLPCEQKRFSMRCLGLDVTLYAMHCCFSRIRCYGNAFQQFAVQQRRLPCCYGHVLREAPPSRWADCSFQVSCHNIFTGVFPFSSVIPADGVQQALRLHNLACYHTIHMS
jgi:hypothetical protein